jgi:hypothetical protein
MFSFLKPSRNPGSLIKLYAKKAVRVNANQVFYPDENGIIFFKTSLALEE